MVSEVHPRTLKTILIIHKIHVHELYNLVKICLKSKTAQFKWNLRYGIVFI